MEADVLLRTGEHTAPSAGPTAQCVCMADIDTEIPVEPIQ